MNQKPKYDLYIGRLQALPANIKYSFYNPTNRCILLYSEEKPKEGDFRIVPTELYEKLQPCEKKWLISAKMAINAEFIKNNAEEFIGLIKDFSINLEKELIIEKENFEKVKNEQQKELGTT